MIFKSIQPGTEVRPTASGEIESRLFRWECFSVQKYGTDYCYQCDLRDTTSCGGKRIRETGTNREGVCVPITEES
jgi:hypothetical protein